MGEPRRFVQAVVAAMCVGIAVACGDAPGDRGSCPEALDRERLDGCLRDDLGIPSDARRVVILGQSSHLDWDWLRTFEDYFRQSVAAIFGDVLVLLDAGAGSDDGWVYSIAEVGYVERYVLEHPEAAERLRAAGRRFRILGGGVTSPDNLLPEGETFIRNYLVGRRWTEAQGLPVTSQAWLPDDFGHDAQLPVVLRAMGLDAVGFARVPGTDLLAQALRIHPPTPGSLADEMLQSGVDFVWRAADGSEVTGHWLSRGYGGEADDLDRPLPEAPELSELDTARRRLQAILGHVLPASRTPYAFIPVGSDFERPKQRLLDYVAAWNETEYPATGVFLVVASFDDYARLVALHRDELPARRFDPTPYWTGHIATRPELKMLHVAATRALLAAETFGVIANGAVRSDPAAFDARARERERALARAWEALVPSTHHDFVNGTSTDEVTYDEQLPLLREALALAEAERDAALDQIAAAVRPATAVERPVVVANPLGFARRGLVASGATTGACGSHVQHAADGGLLFLADAPSLGYATVDLAAPAGAAAGPALPAAPATVEVSVDGGTIAIANGWLRAELLRSVAWGLVSVVDRASGEELVAEGAVANDIVLYEDQGGLYRFGNEMPSCSLTPSPRFASVAAIPSDAEVLEQGPLRVVVRTRVQHEGRDATRTYSLVADEPFLRVEAEGAAPAGTSVMVHFPLVAPLDELVHGTPAHWDAKSLERGWYGLTFEAVHDFAVPRAAGTARAAVLRAGVSAWAARQDGLVIGVLWRDANFERCDAYGPRGTDPDPHVVRYALRVPSGLGTPEDGRALRDSLSFANPLLARQAAGAPGAGMLPPRLALAAVEPSPAILSAGKPAEGEPGAVALRIYQPTNRALRVRIDSALPLLVPDGVELSPRFVTALEATVPEQEAVAADLRGDAGRVELVARRALSTVRIASPDSN